MHPPTHSHSHVYTSIHTHTRTHRNWNPLFDPARPNYCVSFGCKRHRDDEVDFSGYHCEKFGCIKYEGVGDSTFYGLKDMGDAVIADRDFKEGEFICNVHGTWLKKDECHEDSWWEYIFFTGIPLDFHIYSTEFKSSPYHQ